MTQVPALQLQGIEKHYGFVKALAGIDFHVAPGEVVALVGDNGAGKSTLLKVMSGAHQPTFGQITVGGRPVTFSDPRAAADAGVQMVYQDLALIDAADIATNLTLGREPVRRGVLGWLGFLDKKAMRREAEQEINALGVTTAPVTRPVEMLSVGSARSSPSPAPPSASRTTRTGCSCSTSRPPRSATRRPGRSAS